MTTSDAYMEVECDFCNEKDIVEMELRYPDYSGKNAHFRTPFDYDNDEGVKGINTGLLFFCVDDDMDKHQCENCNEDLTGDDNE